ncbi:hypothetical protein DFQ09_102264 [Winogradskyella pacifica]|uniref:Uncharacterized protein n=1 Tax=Winogradskyella pacifica TaxID=664642 RepID=A0A3D9N644_9FLAO|nr:hypothetical protein [Winogradskyella pacifica]REE25673.1 hypothetical protein DFQ09_102264 [Winogradskyella pacifica]
MKSILKTILLLAITLTLFNCDNDDGNAPNISVCSYEGLTAELQGILTLIPASDLVTDYFPNNDGPGIGAYEVNQISNMGGTFVVTKAVTNGAVDSDPEIKINDINYSGVVTCQRAGSAVGDEIRLDIVLASGEEVELCVVIDYVTP